MAIQGISRNLKFSEGVNATAPSSGAPVSGITFDTLQYGQETDSTSSGSTVTLTPTKVVYRVTNAGLVSIDEIDPTTTKVLVLANHTGVKISLLNKSGAATRQIITGTGSDLAMLDESSVTLVYDDTETKWLVVGGSGGGGLALEIKTASFTAEEGKHYLVDTDTAGADVTITALAVSAGVQWAVSDLAKNFSTFSVIINPDGSDTIDEAAQLIMRDDNGAYIFNADEGNSNWVVDKNVIAGNGAIVGPWTEYTPVTQGYGTIASVDIEYRQVGDAIELRGSFVTGTIPTTTEAQFGLPIVNSVQYTVGGVSTATIDVGEFSRAVNQTTLSENLMLSTKGDAFLNLGLNFNGASESALTVRDSDQLHGNTERITIRSSAIPITELAGSGTTNVESQVPDSDVIVNTGNGHGSTNTMIRRFSNVETNTGASITYADSATDGASFTINKAGFYAIEYSDLRVGGQTSFGVSLNSSELTTAIQTITAADRIAHTEAVDSVFNSCSKTLKLDVGDIIRPHTDSTPSDVNNREKFSISHISSPAGTIGVEEATSLKTGVIKKNKWQKKKQTSDLTSSQIVSDLTFNNLVVGNSYKALIQPSFRITGTSALERGIILIMHDSTIVGTAQFRDDSKQADTTLLAADGTAQFTATATTVTFDLTIDGTVSLDGNNSFNETWAMLEELNNYEDETSDFN